MRALASDPRISHIPALAPPNPNRQFSCSEADLPAKSDNSGSLTLVRFATMTYFCGATRSEEEITVYTCERCGTSFGRRTPVVESCPRCLSRDGVRVALTFKLFKGVKPAGASAPIQLRPTSNRQDEGFEAAVRRQLASGGHRAA
jgi:hypothetical protein